MKSKLIVLLGPVGAGKTTQTKLLCRNLRKRGYRVRSAYLNTYYPTIMRLVPGFGRKVRRVEDVRPNLSRRLVSLAVMADVFLLFGVFSLRFFLRALLLRLDFIVVEEYFVGVLINYRFTYSIDALDPNTFNWGRRILARLLALSRNHLVIIDCRPEVLMERWRIRDSLPESMEYVDFQRQTFRHLESFPEIKNGVMWITRIDGNKEKSSVLMEITDAVVRQHSRSATEHDNLGLESR